MAPRISSSSSSSSSSLSLSSLSSVTPAPKRGQAKARSKSTLSSKSKNETTHSPAPSTQTELSSFFSILAKPNTPGGPALADPKASKPFTFESPLAVQTSSLYQQHQQQQPAKKLKLAANTAVAVHVKTTPFSLQTTDVASLSPFQKLVLKRRAENLQEKEEENGNKNVHLFSTRPSESSFHLQRRPIVATPSKSCASFSASFGDSLDGQTSATASPSALFPQHLVLLQKLFYALEATCAFHANREKPPTWHVLKKPVENRCNRTFTLSHLSQILALYPSAYCLTPLRILVDSDIGMKEDSVMIEMIKLVIDEEELDDNDKEADFVVGGNDATNSTVAKSFITAPNTAAISSNAKTLLIGDGKTLFEREKPFAEALEKRREFFRSKCLDYVKACHEKFLTGLSESDRDSYNQTNNKHEPEPQWHPDFNLESHVPEVEGIDIPTVKSVAAMKLSAKSSDTTVTSDTTLYSCHTTTNAAAVTISDALTVSAIPSESKSVSDTTLASSDTPLTTSVPSTSLTASTSVTKSLSTTPATTTPKTKSVLQEQQTPQQQAATPTLSRAAALLQRIREKDRQKNETLANTPKFNSADLKRRAMISRLVEVGRSVMAFFTAKRTSALPMKQVCEYVITGVRNSISYEEAREHIILLSETCPEWCTVVKLQVGTIVKFDATVPDMVVGLRKKMKELLEDGVKKGRENSVII
ncbi:UNVERIFIED_CONTAM: replication licensing factor Cdt1 [Siphonaria sp. JEL0065]|nr:replication licensing factor Cdt1 [Siphonaria sp. JEL0065]